MVYRPEKGSFVSDTGESLTPGFFVPVGLNNFNRFFSSSALRGPLTTIITWNFAYATLSVLCSFALGLSSLCCLTTCPAKSSSVPC